MINVNGYNMRILIISQHFYPEKSGNSSRISDMAKFLSNNDAHVTVLAPFPNFPHGSYKRVWKISQKQKYGEILLINIFSWQPDVKNPTFISRMLYYLSFPLHGVFWTLFNYKKFDVIITSAPPIFTGLVGLFSKIIFKKKWVMDVRDLWINASISLGFLKKGSIFEKMSRIYEKICYSKCDLITVTTQELGDDIIRTYKGTSISKIQEIPNGVDTTFFYPKKIKKKNQIIYAGNIGHAQDLENVILSMEHINKLYDVKLVLVGDGDIKSILENLVKEKQFEKYVEFTGLIDRKHIPKMINESLIGIAPLKNLETLEYAVPTKAYEYMACGIPFVGSGEGEIRKLASQSQGGVISANSPENFSKTILSLLLNKEYMEKLGTQGCIYVNKFYSREHIALKLKDHIEKILITPDKI